MPSAPPKLIAINHDDYHAKYIGKLADGRQFFLTTPFEHQMGDGKSCEYLALFTFSKEGVLIDAKIESFGARADDDHSLPGNQTHNITERNALLKAWLKGLGKVKYQRIEVAPFWVERFDTKFGLIPQAPADEEDSWTVEMLPGNYMAFYEPWDGGDYDT